MSDPNIYIPNFEKLIYRHPEFKDCLDKCKCGGHAAFKFCSHITTEMGMLVCTRCNWRTKNGEFHQIMVEWNKNMRK
jgi:hypothetical protein